MHPNAFLRQLWQMELRPQVFVAMKFGGIYDDRYKNVFVPAIGSITVDGIALQPYRVDLSKSGDSILTDIMDGIAHARFVLADVSTVGNDSKTGFAYRNGNVMYEVGVALACRQSHDVLLVRDDHDRFMFDVSTIPHQTIDFTDIPTAISLLHEELKKRLAQQNFMNDARVQIALASLSHEEIVILKTWSKLDGFAFGRGSSGLFDAAGSVGIPRLIDKGVLRVAGVFDKGQAAYSFTPLGKVVMQLALNLQVFPSVEHKLMPEETKP
jgi:hypothetical protein